MTPIPKLSPIADHDTLQALAEAVAHHHARRSKSALSSDLLKLLVSLLISALMAYGVVNTRIAVVEDRVNTIKADISEIRNDVKLLLQRGNR